MSTSILVFKRKLEQISDNSGGGGVRFNIQVGMFGFGFKDFNNKSQKSEISFEQRAGNFK